MAMLELSVVSLRVKQVPLLLWGGGAGMLGSAPDLECRTAKEEEEEQCS